MKLLKLLIQTLRARRELVSYLSDGQTCKVELCSWSTTVVVNVIRRKGKPLSVFQTRAIYERRVVSAKVNPWFEERQGTLLIRT